MAGEQEKKTSQQSGKQGQAHQGNGGAVATRQEPAHQNRLPAPYGGFGMLYRLREEFDRLFDRLFQGWMAPWGGAETARHWDLDVEDQDDAVVVRAEAPGFEPGDFNLDVRGNQLVLRATRKAETEEKDRGYREWRRHDLHEMVTLPPGVDPDKAEAQYHNGVLTVTLPRTEQARGRRIEVKG